MSEVKRFENFSSGTDKFYASMQEYSKGEYCLYSDYVALEAQLATVQEQLKACAIAAHNYDEAVKLGSKIGYGDDLKKVLICRQSLDDALEQLREATERHTVAEEMTKLLFQRYWEDSGLDPDYVGVPSHEGLRKEAKRALAAQQTGKTCEHERLNEEGFCRQCSADCRGAH